MPGEIVVKVPIRRITVVVDTQDQLAPEMTIEDFRNTFGQEPDPPRYRLVNIEVITPPDDQQPMLVTECARYGRFVKRESGNVYFRRQLDEF